MNYFILFNDLITLEITLKKDEKFIFIFELIKFKRNHICMPMASDF